MLLSAQPDNVFHRQFGSDGQCFHFLARAEDVVDTEEDPRTGVPAGLVPHLFEPFARGTDARLVEGSGLGLTIVRGLAQALGGRVWYESRHPRGARFVLSLRKAAAAATSAA